MADARNTKDKNGERLTEGVEALRLVDMVVNGLAREVYILPSILSAQSATNTEWLSLLPWSITSSPIDEILFCFGIAVTGKPFAGHATTEKQQ